MAAGQEREKKIQYLQQYREAVKEMERKREKIDITKLQKRYPSAVPREGSRGGGTSDLSDYAVSLEEKTQEYIAARYKRVKISSEIMEKIKQMDSEKERDILIYKHILLYEFKETAQALGETYRNTMKIYEKALESLRI